MEYINSRAHHRLQYTVRAKSTIEILVLETAFNASDENGAAAGIIAFLSVFFLPFFHSSIPVKYTTTITILSLPLNVKE